MILSILRAWDNPLHHMETELKSMPGAPFAILARVKDIEVKNKIDQLGLIEKVCHVIDSPKTMHFLRSMFLILHLVLIAGLKPAL